MVKNGNEKRLRDSFHKAKRGSLHSHLTGFGSGATYYKPIGGGIYRPGGYQLVRSSRVLLRLLGCPPDSISGSRANPNYDLRWGFVGRYRRYGNRQRTPS